MDTNFSEKFNELFQKWQNLSSEVEALRVEIENLKALQETVPAADDEPIDEEPIDIDLSIEDFSAPATPPVEMTEEVPPVEMTEPEEGHPRRNGPIFIDGEDNHLPAPEAEPAAEPEPEADGDMPESLFGDVPEPVGDAGKGRRRAPRAVYQTASAPKAVIDAMSAKAAWRVDMPGPEVRSLRSAIALGDQVVFINRLFRKDSSLYQSTIDILNNTPTLSAAIDYLSETFPEWDLESEDVYRFMMAVRRKIRK